MIRVGEYLCLGRKYLVYNLVSRNIKVKYRRSVFGFLWTLISPLSLAAMYYFVFGHVLHVQVTHYLAHIVCGVLAWNFFSGTFVESLDALTVSQPLISKTPVPVQVFAWVATLTNSVTLSLAIPVIVGVLVATDVSIRPTLFAAPLFLIGLFLIVYALSSIASIAYVYFRDLKHATSIALQLWLYATPVFYSRDMIPAEFDWVIYANPLASTWCCLHDVVLRGVLPEPSLLLSVAFWICTLTFANGWVLTRFGKQVAENL